MEPLDSIEQQMAQYHRRVRIYIILYFLVICGFLLSGFLLSRIHMPTKEQRMPRFSDQVYQTAHPVTILHGPSPYRGHAPLLVYWVRDEKTGQEYDAVTSDPASPMSNRATVYFDELSTNLDDRKHVPRQTIRWIDLGH